MCRACWSRERGSVIVADLVLGAAIVLILAAAATAAATAADAVQSSREAARNAAVEIARGNEPEGVLRRVRLSAPQGASIEYEIADGNVRVNIESNVDLAHPVMGAHRIRVAARVDVPIAPYRSW